MFEIHYHLLFGVDDGPRDVSESLALAEASIAEGVTHIVCTPHSNYEFRFNPDINMERLALINEQLKGTLTLGMGCDLHLSYENIVDALHNHGKYTINGTRYLLVELPDFFVFKSISEGLRQLSASGLIPIITHPERNPLLVGEPSRLDEWIGIGCLTQITAGALLGRFGRRAEAFSFDQIRSNRVHLVASDAHSMDWRPPAMKDAAEVIKARCGEEVAQRLCIHNPRAVFFGESLPPQPNAKKSLNAIKAERSVLKSTFRRWW